MANLSKLAQLAIDAAEHLFPPFTPEKNHPLVARMLVAVVLTGLLAFVIMPLYTRLVWRWLYQDAE